MPRTQPRYDDFDAGSGGFLARATDVLRRRPADSLAVALAAACTAMTLFNALAMQQSRQQPAATAATPAPQRSDLVAQVQGALADAGYYDGALDGLIGARTAAAIRAFEQANHMEPTGQASERLLAAILTAPPRKAELIAPKPAAASPQPASPTITGSTSTMAPAKLMAVQKALAKLGYGPVTIDGKLGAETRQALISFERDRKMPETGEPTPPVLRALQAVSGAPLQ